MERNSYPMKKLGYDATDYGKGKTNNCSFYVKYFLFCTSVIQLLIILGLVLFMVYGNAYGNQQMRKVMAHNQSVHCIQEKMKVQAQASKLGKMLNASKDQVAKLHTANKTLNALNICLATIGIQFHGNCSIIKPGPNKAAPTKNPVSDPAMVKLIMHMVDPKNGLMQLKNCSNGDLENKLKLAKFEEMLLDTQLRQQKRELGKEKENWNRRIRDLANNCTSLSQEFQKAAKEITSTYESHFSKLLGPFDFNLKQLKANCSPLASTVQRDFQSQLDRIDSQITSYFGRVWGKTSELESLYAECQETTKALSEEIEAKKTVHEKDIDAHLAEQVKLLREMKGLMGNGQHPSGSSSGNQKKDQNDLMLEIIKHLLGSKLTLPGSGDGAVE